MKIFSLSLVAFLGLSQISFATETDSLLIGKWNLFKIIDNMTGNETVPPKPNEDFNFSISFQDSVVHFNLEINRCENSYEITGLHQIKFLFYDECTKICCDHFFSSLLTYADCTGYFIRNENTLVLVSEDRIFYFSKAVD